MLTQFSEGQISEEGRWYFKNLDRRKNFWKATNKNKGVKEEIDMVHG